MITPLQSDCDHFQVAVVTALERTILHSADPRPADGVGNVRKCVLVVEDDPIILMNTADIIERAGYDVLEASSADEALAKLEANPQIAVMVTDVEMPGPMNGLRLAFLVRNRWPPLHIIVVSGHVRLGDNELPERAQFIGKPYLTSEIEEALRSA